MEGSCRVEAIVHRWHAIDKLYGVSHRYRIDRHIADILVQFVERQHRDVDVVRPPVG